MFTFLLCKIYKSQYEKWIYKFLHLNSKYINFGTQNLRPANVKVIFLAAILRYIAVASGFIAGTAHVVSKSIFMFPFLLLLVEAP